MKISEALIQVVWHGLTPSMGLGVGVGARVVVVVCVDGGSVIVADAVVWYASDDSSHHIQAGVGSVGAVNGDDGRVAMVMGRGPRARAGVVVFEAGEVAAVVARGVVLLVFVLVSGKEGPSARGLPRLVGRSHGGR